jgi:hypothetical protein
MAPAWGWEQARFAVYATFRVEAVRRLLFGAADRGFRRTASDVLMLLPVWRTRWGLGSGWRLRLGLDSGSVFVGDGERQSTQWEDSAPS